MWVIRASGLPAQAACSVLFELDPSCWVHLTLLLGGPGRTQLTRGTRMHNHSGPHSQAFCLFQSPVLHQEAFLKSHVSLCCRWPDLAPEPQGPPTQTSNKLHAASFPTTDLSGIIGSARSYGPSGRTACTTVRTCCRALSALAPIQGWRPYVAPEI